MSEIHNVLYVTPDGQFKRSASYSSRGTFKHCKQKFYLERVQGWRSKREGAAMDFGKIAEAAICHHLENSHQGGPEKFLELWDAYKLSPGFEKKEYTKVEESWENLRRVGHEQLRLFAVRSKAYPFQEPKFQVPLNKKIFPGTSYDAISNTAYLDIVSYPGAFHPMLPRVEHGEGINSTGRRKLITDVKTASKELPEHLTVLDPQLIEYAWMDGETDLVAFLWLVKKSHGFKFKSRVTLLEDVAGLSAGDEVLVIDKAGDDVWVSNPGVAEMYDKLFTGKDGKTITGNAAKAVHADFLNLNLATLVPQSAVTKQLVQFAAARIAKQDLEDMGKVVGQLTVEMVVAHETGFYPKEPGLRFPSEKCPMCDMRFICSGDGDGRDRFLTKAGEEWLDTTIEE